MPTLRSPRVRTRLSNPAAPPVETSALALYPTTTAALRPSSPPGKGLHRASDTGVVTLWDGAAWRDVAASAGVTSDTITPTHTPGGATSGQDTVLITVTDANGNPRIGTPVRLTHTSNAVSGVSYSAPTLNIGTQLAAAQNADNNGGFVLAVTDVLGRVRAVWNSPSGITTTVTAAVLSEAPAALTLAPFTSP